MPTTSVRRLISPFRLHSPSCFAKIATCTWRNPAAL
jgi:hypothetical protein